MELNHLVTFIKIINECIIMNIPACTESDSAFTRGRIPPHEVNDLYRSITLLGEAKRRKQIIKRMMVKGGMFDHSFVRRGENCLSNVVSTLSNVC